MRDGREKTVTVETAKRQDEQTLASKETENDDKLGLSLQSLEPEMAARLGYDEAEKGVLVTGVEGGSKADKAGVQQGDLIKEINRKPVAGMDDFRKQLNKVKKGDPIMLLLKRGPSGFIVAKMTR
jgi:serine protease Do